MKDYLADMIARIKTGCNANLPVIEMDANMSKACYAVLNILQDEGYIQGFSQVTYPKTRTVVYLKYTNLGVPVISGISKISGAGRRIRLSTKSLWKPKNSRGVFILSTSKGVITDKEARQFNVGGEVLCCVF